MHDRHHERGGVNFGGVGVWDWVWGTGDWQKGGRGEGGEIRGE